MVRLGINGLETRETTWPGEDDCKSDGLFVVFMLICANIIYLLRTKS